MFEDDGNYLPWDSLWDYLLGDEELDSIPTGKNGQRRKSRHRNVESQDGTPIKIQWAASKGHREQGTQFRNQENLSLRNKDSQTGMRSVHSMTSEKTPQQSNASCESRNDQSFANERVLYQQRFDRRGEETTEGTVTAEHFRELTREGDGERSKNSKSDGTVRRHDGTSFRNIITEDKASLHWPKNEVHGREHVAPTDDVCASFEASLRYEEPAETVRLQYHPRREQPSDYSFTTRNRFNGILREEMPASHTMLSSFIDQSYGAPTATCVESIHTNPFDASLKTAKHEVERKAAQKMTTSTSRSAVVRRVACCSIKNLSELEHAWTMEMGIPIYQLSHDELIKTFPKLLAVTDNRAEVIGRSSEFQHSFPAHLQASLTIRGEPQSLYEYNYESEEHRFVSYKSFSPVSQALMCVEVGKLGRPPAIGTSDVLIQVEASTVSRTDCFIRQGFWWGSDFVPLPNTPGVDVLGKISRIDKRSSRRFNLKAGDRVMSLVKWGGNSRYLQIDPARAVKVPETIDPASAVCLTETYLSAYQILFHGVLGKRRQKKGSLRGRTYMLFGQVDPKFASAISEVAKYAGVKTIYASANRKRFKQLQSHGIVPFDQENTDFMKAMKGKIDRIVSFEQEYSQLQFDLLGKDGDIILACCGGLKMNEVRGQNMFCSKATSQQRGKTYAYDVFKEWEERIDKCKNDLIFLVDLLGKDIISPRVLARISLHQVAKAHEMLEKKRLPGFLVCEPWLVAKSRAIRL